MSPVFSIIIPNFNDPRIERTIKSITDQKFSSYELIIVEGCVKNTRTEGIYSKYIDRIDKLIHESDNGIFDALNKGIRSSTGNVILLIGSDDRLGDPDVFSNVSNLLNEKPTAHGVCIECHFVNFRGRVIRKWIPRKVSKHQIRWGILPPHFSLFLKRELYDKVGLFNLSEGNLGLDSKWLLSLGKMDLINIPVLNGHSVLMELGGTSTGSFKNIWKANIKIAKEAKRLNYSNWMLIPLIKVISKLPQFLK